MSENKTEERIAREDLDVYAQAITDFETQDLGDELEEMPQANFEVHLSSRRTLYPLDAELSTRLQTIAHQRGISPERLLNKWVQEKVRQVARSSDEKAAEILTVGTAD